MSEVEQSEQVSQPTPIHDIYQALAAESDVDADPYIEDHQSDAGEEVVQEEVLSPYENWPEEFKSKFDSLNDLHDGQSYQQALLDLYSHMHKDYQSKTNNLSVERKNLETQTQFLNQVQSLWGQDSSAALQQMQLAQQWMQAYQQDPTGTAQYLAKKTGLRLDEALPDEYLTEDLDDKRLKEAVAPLEAQQQQLANQVQQLNASQQQALRNNIATAIRNSVQNFKSEKDGNGHLKHPYFETVKDEMYKLFQTGYVNFQDPESLSKAYDYAVKLQGVSHPVTAGTVKRPGAGVRGGTKAVNRDISQESQMDTILRNFKRLANKR